MTSDPAAVFVGRLKALVPEGESRLYAKRAHVREEMFSKWRTGALRPNMKLDTLTRVARALGVGPGYLISEAPNAEVEAEIARLHRQVADLQKENAFLWARIVNATAELVPRYEKETARYLDEERSAYGRSGASIAAEAPTEATPSSEDLPESRGASESKRKRS